VRSKPCPWRTNRSYALKPTTSYLQLVCKQHIGKLTVLIKSAAPVCKEGLHGGAQVSAYLQIRMSSSKLTSYDWGTSLSSSTKCTVIHAGKNSLPIQQLLNYLWSLMYQDSSDHVMQEQAFLPLRLWCVLCDVWWTTLSPHAPWRTPTAMQEWVNHNVGAQWFDWQWHCRNALSEQALLMQEHRRTWTQIIAVASLDSLNSVGKA